MPSQSPRDLILWILTNSCGKMERSRLRRCAGIKLADLDPILVELAREGRIRILDDIVSLKSNRDACSDRAGEHQTVG
jgi:hypothetical protein